MDKKFEGKLEKVNEVMGKANENLTDYVNELCKTHKITL